MMTRRSGGAWRACSPTSNPKPGVAFYTFQLALGLLIVGAGAITAGG
ncbi:MAG: hypothetical protein WCP28_11085 [Actinomycetes bacterium]